MNQEAEIQGQRMPFSFLTIKNLTSKLITISGNPIDIYREFNNQQPGFFVEVVKKEFGIGTESSKRFVNDFKEQLKELNENHQTELDA